MKIYGLTGGVASGKSTVARIFSEAGVPVIDADQISRDLSAPGGLAHAPIFKRFGTVDRTRLRELIFRDPKARQDLEAILHPLIQLESESRMKSLNAPVVIYEATLLIETGRYKDFDGLIVVEAPRETRKARLIFRDKNMPDLAEQILNSQSSDEERRKFATHVVRNYDTIEELEAKVKRLLPLL